MAALWRIRFGGREIGPYPLRVFQMLRAEGRMPPDAEARREDGTAWMPFEAARDEPAPAAAAPSRPPPLPQPPALPQLRPLPPPGIHQPPPLPRRGAATGPAEAPAPRRFWPAYCAVMLLPLALLAAALTLTTVGSHRTFDPRPWMEALALIYLAVVLHWCASTWWTWRRTAGMSSEPRRVTLRGVSLLYGLMAAGFVFAQQGLVFDIWRFAAQPDKFAGFSISADAQARTITIEGPIGFDLIERFRRVRAEHPEAETLVLDSPGGWIWAARGVAAQLAGTRLRTALVREQCASACTLIFEQAPHRVLERGAHLGFHAGRNDLREGLGDVEEANRQMAELLARRDIPRSVIDRINQTPNAQMWWPSAPELFSDHLIDAVRFERRDLAAPDYYLAEADQVMTAPAMARFYDSLRLLDAPAYEALRATLARAVATNQDGTAIKAAMEKVEQPVEQRALAHGGDLALQQRARFVARLLSRMRPVNPDACRAYWDGSSAFPWQQMNAAEKTDSFDTMAALMRSAAQRNGAQDGRQPERALLLRVYGDALRRYGNAALDTRAAQRAGRLGNDDVCVIAISTYSNIAGLPQDQAGAVMRWIALAR